MRYAIKRLIKKVFNRAGLDIIRLRKENTLLGLNQFPIRSIIDVGANIGQSVEMFLSVFPNAHIYSFEPLPKPFAKLKKWAASQSDKVTVFNLALGDSEGTIKMFSYPKHSPSSSILPSTEICTKLYPFTQKQTPVPIKLKTLDKVSANLSKPLLPDILIKLDVQGYEDRVIKGGMETFRKARICILEVNLDLLYEDQPTFKEIFLLLNELGYHYAGNLNQAFSKKDGHIISIDAVFVK